MELEEIAEGYPVDALPEVAEGIEDPAPAWVDAYEY